jgi:hypothetical protein
MTEYKYDVFLSHSSKNKAVANQLAQRLRGDQVRVWLDEWEILAGANIRAIIVDGLRESRTLVLCMSRTAIQSD